MDAQYDNRRVYKKYTRKICFLNINLLLMIIYSIINIDILINISNLLWKINR